MSLWRLHVANAINGFSGSGATPVETSRTTQQVTRDTDIAAPADTGSHVGEQVSITGAASQLARIGQQLSALPAIDAARVAGISQSLAEGAYRISPEKIASGLLLSDHVLAQIGI
jgi:negative regulator of flagellin synthesis FlgM